MTVEHVGTAWEQGATESLQKAIAAAEQTNTPLLLRFNLDLYDRIRQQYVKWRGQIWKVELTEGKLEQAVGLRDALGLFFTLYGRVGAVALSELLTDALASTETGPTPEPGAAVETVVDEAEPDAIDEVE